MLFLHREEMMKALLAAALFAGVLALLSWSSGQGIDPTTVGAIRASTPGVFELSRNGGLETCLVQRAPARAKENELVEYGCDRLVPAFEKTLYWSEGANGSIAFVTKDGRRVVEFAPADGEGYESFAPRQPMLTLIEKR
jgi:hypothetical protein